MGYRILVASGANERKGLRNTKDQRREQGTIWVAPEEDRWHIERSVFIRKDWRTSKKPCLKRCLDIRPKWKNWESL